MAGRQRQWRAREDDSVEVVGPSLTSIDQPDPGDEGTAIEAGRREAEVPALEELEPDEWWDDRNAQGS